MTDVLKLHLIETCFFFNPNFTKFHLHLPAKGTLSNFLHQHIAETLSTHHYHHQQQFRFTAWRLGPANKSGNQLLAFHWCRSKQTEKTILATFARKQNHFNAHRLFTLKGNIFYHILFTHFNTNTEPAFINGSNFQKLWKALYYSCVILGSNRSKLRGIFEVMVIALNEKTWIRPLQVRSLLFLASP